jgi:hypothetical protein
MKSAKDLANDIRTKMQNTPIKVNIDANKNILTSNIKQALKNQTFKADLKLSIQTVDVQQAIRDAFAKAGLAYNTTASNVRAALINTRQQKADAYVDAQKALADLRRAQMASAQAAAQHKNAMQGVNDVASKQKSLMTQLAQKIADLYSVVRIGDFVANMVRIGGEFEQQKVALGTIVGDASKAGALFERIKNLAVESPYKFGDLAAYSKQLAAFGIEYNELNQSQALVPECCTVLHNAHGTAPGRAFPHCEGNPAQFQTDENRGIHHRSQSRHGDLRRAEASSQTGREPSQHGSAVGA